jgi:hypothetical protein
MKLYYMTAQEFGPRILRQRRLKISTVPELNDPFELLGASIGERDMRWIMQLLHEHWTQTLGMICLTDNWHSPVMWAHYAQKHHGFSFGFDVSDRPELISKIDYVPDRLRYSLQHTKRLPGVNQALLVQILTTKYQAWSYEREYRLFTEIKDRDPDGRYYFDFGPDLILREVILGARCELNLHSVASEIKSPPQRVEVFKARPAVDSFRIVRDSGIPGITIDAVTSP